MRDRRGTIIIFVLILIVIGLGIISFIPFNTVPYQKMETYYDTVTKQEPYVTKEPYTVQESVNKQETIFDGKPYSVPFGTNVPVVIDQPAADLVGHFELPGSGGIRVLLPSNRILYEQLGKRGDFRITLSQGQYSVILRDSMVWGEPVYLNLVLSWTEDTDVTKYREVTKNRDVSVHVQKQRLITGYVKASWWEMIFGIDPKKYGSENK